LGIPGKNGEIRVAGKQGFESRFHDPESCVLIKSYIKLLSFQPSQPLPGILYLRYPRVGVLPEVEEFLVMLDGPGCTPCSSQIILKMNAHSINL